MNPFTLLNRIAQPFLGAGRSRWGILVNGMIEAVDETQGAATVDVTSGGAVLSSLQGASDQSRRRAIVCTGTPSAQTLVSVPAAPHWYHAVNRTAFPVAIGCGGKVAVVPRQGTAHVLCDGQDCLTMASDTPEPLTVIGISVDTTLTRDQGGLCYVSQPVAVTLPVISSLPAGWNTDICNATSVPVSVSATGTDAQAPWLDFDYLGTDDGNILASDDGTLLFVDLVPQSGAYPVQPGRTARFVATARGWIVIRDRGAVGR